MSRFCDARCGVFKLVVKDIDAKFLATIKGHTETTMEGTERRTNGRSFVDLERARAGDADYVARVQNPLRAAPFASSYDYEWDNLDPVTFPVLGAIIRRAPDGSPRFNFPQTIWLYPKISMNWSERLTRQTETLAVNLLAPWMSTQRQRMSGLSAERLAIVASCEFAQEVLCSMPTDGGFIPREVIQEWIRSAL
jgi:hypothetical protein